MTTSKGDKILNKIPPTKQKKLKYSCKRKFGKDNIFELFGKYLESYINLKKETKTKE